MSESPERMPVAEAIVSARRRPSIVWLIPLVAAVVGAFVAWRTFSERGPEIHIEFPSAEGLEAGKTQIKYKDVEVGIVEQISLKPDLSGVVCTARMVKGAESYLTEGTRFWVATARITASQITGLGTLLSGAFIGIDPSREGKRSRHFVGLATQPVVTSDEPGKHFVLRSYRAGSVPLGSPVLFRKIQVGEVVSSDLDPSGDFVTISIFVHLPHDVRVTEDTRFWNASGFEVKLSASGVEVDVGSLTSVLIGGIAFETPDETAPPAPDGTTFDLYENEAATKRPVYTKRTTWLVYFDQSVRGLNPGAPVEFRGIQVGEVRDVRLEYDAEKQRFRIPVLIDIEPERLGQLGSEDPKQRRESLDRLVQEGMRAQLASGNLLTGQLLVSLDMQEAAAPAKIVWSKPYPVFPSVPTPLEEITSSVTRLTKKLEDLPLDEIVASLNSTLESARAALEQADRTLATASTAVGPDSPLQTELRRALLELSDAARSVGLAADQIERQPNSLIFGRGDEK
jgi:paraquat-inducible protein B